MFAFCSIIFKGKCFYAHLDAKDLFTNSSLHLKKKHLVCNKVDKRESHTMMAYFIDISEYSENIDCDSDNSFFFYNLTDSLLSELCHLLGQR